MEEWLAKVDAVTSDDVGEEAERLLDGRVLSLSVVGNVGKLPLTAPDLAAAL
jgi:predicted Zn-dependent peptidase